MIPFFKEVYNIYFYPRYFLRTFIGKCLNNTPNNYMDILEGKQDTTSVLPITSIKLGDGVLHEEYERFLQTSRQQDAERILQDAKVAADILTMEAATAEERIKQLESQAAADAEFAAKCSDAISSSFDEVHSNKLQRVNDDIKDSNKRRNHHVNQTPHSADILKWFKSNKVASLNSTVAHESPSNNNDSKLIHLEFLSTPADTKSGVCIFC